MRFHNKNYIYIINQSNKLKPSNNNNNHLTLKVLKRTELMAMTPIILEMIEQNQKCYTFFFINFTVRLELQLKL